VWLRVRFVGCDVYYCWCGWGMLVVGVEWL